MLSVSTDPNNSLDYAVPDLTKSSLIVNKPGFTPNIYPEDVPPPIPPHPVGVYSGPGDVMGFPNLQGNQHKQNKLIDLCCPVSKES